MRKEPNHFIVAIVIILAVVLASVAASVVDAGAQGTAATDRYRFDRGYASVLVTVDRVATSYAATYEVEQYDDPRRVEIQFADYDALVVETLETWELAPEMPYGIDAMSMHSTLMNLGGVDYNGIFVVASVDREVYMFLFLDPGFVDGEFAADYVVTTLLDGDVDAPRGYVEQF